VLEVLWQGFAFQSEESIDRAVARERSLAYLRSVFPDRFKAGAPMATGAVLPAWAYASGPLLALERERLLRPAWQVVGYTGLEEPKGRPAKVSGVVHDLTHVLAGAAPGDLTSLEMTRAGPLLLARPRQPGGEAPMGWPAEWPDLRPGRVAEKAVAANWKIVVEQWLERDSPRRCFLAPNQLLELGAERAQLLQIVPEARDRSRLICFGLLAGHGAGRRSGAGRRGASPPLGRQVASAESSQRGLETSLPQAQTGTAVPAALTAFRRSVATLLPLLAHADKRT
jgi:hypothetical protein